MIIFLCGQDRYRREMRMREIVLRFSTRDLPGAICFADAAEEDGLAKAEEFLKTTGLFGSGQLLVMKNGKAAAKRTHLKKLLAALNKKGEIEAVIELDEISRDFSSLSSLPNIIERYDYLGEKDFEVFLKTEGEKAGLVASPDIYAFLASVFRGDTWGGVTEVQKLALLPRQQITLKIIRTMGVRRRQDFFPLIQKLVRGGVGEVLLSLELLLRDSEPAKIFHIAAYQNEKTRYAAAALDINIKRGKLEYEEAVLALALS